VTSRTASDAKMGALVVESLSLAYEGAWAVRDVSFTLEPGSVLAVLGANGAGKSSLSRAICGLVPSVSGKVTLGDEVLTGLAPHRVARMGVSYVPEGRGIFPDLNVLENLKMAVRLQPRGVRQQAFDDIFDMFPGLCDRLKQRAGTLSGGEQQMLALSRAFCGNTKLLIADELSLGLAPILVGVVFDALKRAKERGMTVIIAEQFVERALEIADHCVILQRGNAVWSGPATAAGAEVQARYLGSG
jgi:branched-chain amino acid transport system ATP-binding protein